VEEKRECRRHPLYDTGAGVGEHPNLPETASSWITLIEPVAQNADQGQIGGRLSGFVRRALGEDRNQLSAIGKAPYFGPKLRFGVRACKYTLGRKRKDEYGQGS
jgi:hypothetical protein